MTSKPQNRFVKFFKNKAWSILHPLKAAQKEIEEKRLNEHTRKMQTDPEYLADVLDPKKPEQKAQGGYSIGSIMTGFVTFLVGVSMLGPITKEINNMANLSSSQNVTTPAIQMTNTLLTFIPILFVVGLLGIGLIISINGLRSAGLI